jgi:hypothetical protein
LTLRRADSQAAFPAPERVIQAEGNLKSDKFADIARRLGIDAATFELQYKWIDGELLRQRNDIAHGSSSFTDIEFADEAVERVGRLIDDFRTAAQNAVVAEAYRR